MKTSRIEKIERILEIMCVDGKNTITFPEFDAVARSKQVNEWDPGRIKNYWRNFLIQKRIIPIPNEHGKYKLDFKEED